MKRRDLLKTLGYVSPLAALPAGSMAGIKTQTGWLQEFSERWDVSEWYNREVFEAMPEENFDYKPVPEVMSFGKQCSHLAMGISIYASILRGDSHTEEPEASNKEIVLNYLDVTSREFKEVYTNLTEDVLYTKEHKHKKEEVWKEFSVADILLLAYHHTAHHRAQAIVYLRLKGIEPPKYRF